jgi:hypothetical protein
VRKGSGVCLDDNVFYMLYYCYLGIDIKIQLTPYDTTPRGVLAHGAWKTQLEKPNIPLSRLEVLLRELSPSTTGFVKRADRSEGEICAPDDYCYPYPHPIKDMYEWYKDATW